MMFIYFWEQVWTFGPRDSSRHNFKTDEVSRTYWDQYRCYNRGSYYPTSNMEEGVDYLDY